MDTGQGAEAPWETLRKRAFRACLCQALWLPGAQAGDSGRGRGPGLCTQEAADVATRGLEPVAQYWPPSWLHWAGLLSCWKACSPHPHVPAQVTPPPHLAAKVTLLSPP